MCPLIARSGYQKHLAWRGPSVRLLFRQIHLAQERLVARIAFEVGQQWLPFNRIEAGVLLRIRTLQPLEGSIAVVPIRISPRDTIRVAIGLLGNKLFQRGFRLAIPVGSIPIARSTFRCLACPCVVLGRD